MKCIAGHRWQQGFKKLKEGFPRSIQSVSLTFLLEPHSNLAFDATLNASLGVFII